MRLYGIKSVIQVQEFITLDFSTHLSIINSGRIPANAMDDSKKDSNFNKEFSEFIDELSVDEQVNKVEETINQSLYTINKMIKHLPMLKNTSEFSEYSKKLTQLIQKLIKQIEEKNALKQTRSSSTYLIMWIPAYLNHN